MTADMVKEWLRLDQDALQSPSASIQTANEMLIGIEHRVAALHTVADVLYTRWVEALR